MAVIKNRRRGPDRMVKIVTIYSILTWVIIIAAFVLFQLAKPAGKYYSVRATLLDFSLAIIIMKVLLFLNLVLCTWGIVANLMRNKRKSDRFRISLVISTVMSLAGFILIMVFL
jgi:hypothetical protein